MAKIFRKSGKYTLDLTHEVMSQYYADLLDQDLSIDFVDAFDTSGKPAVTVHGVPASACIRVMPLKDRAMGRGDVEITFDGYLFDRMTENQKKALIDHELYHLETKRNKDGEIKRDDLGRVEYKLRPHDREFGWFDSIARRWGKDSHEYQQAITMVNDPDFVRIYLTDETQKDNSHLNIPSQKEIQNIN
jgi:hypothetical protein